MLSEEEKKEMLDDARDAVRRDNFRAGHMLKTRRPSFDEYLVFLNNIQEIFAPFKISRSITRTKYNKL